MASLSLLLTEASGATARDDALYISSPHRLSIPLDTSDNEQRHRIWEIVSVSGLQEEIAF